MTAAICDSDRNWLDEATEIINNTAEELGIDAQIVCFENPGEVRKSLRSTPDVMFINKDFGSIENDVIDEQRIRNYFPDCQIVFLDDGISCPVDANYSDTVFCVSKSEFRSKLPEIIRSIRSADKEPGSYIILRTTDGNVTRIPCSEIVYLERSNRRTFIITAAVTYQVRSRLPEILDKLPENEFARCHASFAVNLSKVREIHSKNLVLDDGTELMISRGFSKSFRLKFMNKSGDRMVQ